MKITSILLAGSHLAKKQISPKIPRKLIVKRAIPMKIVKTHSPATISWENAGETFYFAENLETRACLENVLVSYLRIPFKFSAHALTLLLKYASRFN